MMKCPQKTLVISLFNNSSLIKLILSLTLSLGLYFNTYTQEIFTSINSVYDDSAVEWKIYGYDLEDNEWTSELRIKWPLRNDWTEWLVDHNNNFYSLKQRWQHSPVQWELQNGNSIVTIRQKWRNDLNEWVISYNNKSYRWQTTRFNDLSAWYLEIDESTYFDMWTTYSGDIRDWDIEDKAENLASVVKIAALFTTVYLTIPKQ